MTTTENTTPMPDWLPLDSPTAKLQAVAAVLRWRELNVEAIDMEAADDLEKQGATFDEAYDLLHPSLMSPWSREDVVGAIDAELDRRKGTPLPGLGEDS